MAVTLEEMKGHLNIVSAIDNILIQTYLTTAEVVVVSFLGYALDSELMTEMGTPVVLVDQAVRVICAEMYRDRENTTTSGRYDSSLSMARLLGQYQKINIVY